MHGLYQPVANVAAHYGWSYGLQLPEAIALPGGHLPGFVIAPAPLEGVLSGVAVPAGIWQGRAAARGARRRLRPRHDSACSRAGSVLAALARLRGRSGAW